MAQDEPNVDYVILPEFVDDASERLKNGPVFASRDGPETFRRLVARIAREVGFREINLDPILNQLVVDMGAELEDRVRKVLLKMIEDDRKASEDSSAA